MDIDRAIDKRRTVRDYQDKKIPAKLIEDIIRAGCQAPSLHNLQPWRFILLTENYKKRVADIMLKRAEKELVFLNAVLRNNASIIEKAPLAIAVYNTRPLSARFKRLGRFYENRSAIWETQSVACCIENIFLKATALGLGSAFIGSALLCEKEINKCFEVKDKLMAILTLGYPKKMPPKTKRKKFKEIISLL